MDLGPLTETIQIADEFRRNALDQLGPLAPVVTGAGQIITVALALGALAFGRSFWAPPSELSNFPVRIGGLISGVGIVALFVWSKNEGTPLWFLGVAGIGVLIGAAGALVYNHCRSVLCFRCPNRNELYIMGLDLTENAKRVLAGQGKGKFRPRGGPPANAIQYFCNTDTTADPVWTRESRARAESRLHLRYLFFMVPILIGLASASFALTQPELKIEANTISLPGDVLFDFGKDNIRPGAAYTLEDAAKVMRDRRVISARIEGHTDAIGTDPVNKELSERRAKAVRDWLMTQGGLAQVKFTVDPRGASEPVAPEKNADGSDNPAGRALNRRVKIVLSG
jgi:outer membrane protein OmpA-like peptidoglycan-associated protein